MDRTELLIVGVLLVVILIGLGVQQFGRPPRVEPLIIESPLRPDRTGRQALGLAAAGMAEATGPRAAGSPASLLPDLNCATAIELQQVPGIGPALSASILSYRDRHGPFRRMDDLLEVSGIGPSRLERIRGYFSIPGEASSPQPDPIRAIPPPVIEGPSGIVASSQERIDLNTASTEQLETLPGIGPVLAERIVDYRDFHGPFEHAEQLMDVPGIGVKRFAQVASQVGVTGRPTVERVRAASPPRAQSEGSLAASSSTLPGPFAKKEQRKDRINLNTATRAQLESLPGIGPVLAERIERYRLEHGGFQSREQLKAVSGIGEKRYAQIYPLIEVR